MDDDRKVLEAELPILRAAVATALERKRQARVPLTAIEARAKMVWKTRRAVEESLLITKRAAVNSGLHSSPLTLSTIERFEAMIQTARDEIRAILSSAKEVCENYDSSCAALRRAREQEAAALTALLAMPEVENNRSCDQRGALEKELSATQHSRQLEEHEEDALWTVEARFDPQYDPREIAIRRMRPWV
jgi:hypothetical protein